MKKTLLLLLSFVAALGVSAQTTIQWANAAAWTTSGDGITYNQDGYSLKAVKNNGTNAPVVNGTSNDLRVYAAGTLTVSAEKLTKIVFNISAQGLKRLSAENTVNTGTLTVSEDHKTVTWEGEASSVSLTVGAKGTLGTDRYEDGGAKAGQFDIESLIVTGTPGESKGDSINPPTPTQTVTIAEAQKAEAGTTLAVEGTVLAVSKSGVVLGDKTGYIYMYNSAHGLTLGEKVNVAGAVSAYGGFNQFTNSATITKLGNGQVQYPNAFVMEGADLDEWITEPEISYIQVTGKLSISGNYFNLNVEGAETAVGSLVGPTDALMDGITNGSTITVTGFAMYTSGTKYVNIIATEIVLGEKAPVTNITNTLETAYTVSQAIALIDKGEGLEQKVYIKGIVSDTYKDKIIDNSYWNATFFISEDGTKESAQFEIYRGYDFGGEKFTDENKIKLGDEVVFYGTLTKYNTTYETNQGAELVLLNGKAEGISQLTNAAAAGRIYDLQGRAAAKAQKGLFIMNGKKVIK